MKKRYHRMLSKDSDFARDDAADVAFTYGFGDPRLAELDAKWGLREIAGIGDTQTRALNLLHWLCAHTRHGNPQSLPEDLRMDAAALLDWSFDRPGNDPNGKHLSIILCECLLAEGIKAYALWCFPKVFNGQKTCVVQAWLPEESRWIMLDPSWDAYFTDESGRILGAQEVRKRLGSGAPPRLIPEGQGVADWYFGSMAKNMYYFSRTRDTEVGMLDAERVAWVFLLPAGYEPEKKGYPAHEADTYASWENFWKG